jgi:hypothetical protein
MDKSNRYRDRAILDFERTRSFRLITREWSRIGGFRRLLPTKMYNLFGKLKWPAKLRSLIAKLMSARGKAATANETINEAVTLEHPGLRAVSLGSISNG